MHNTQNNLHIVFLSDEQIATILSLENSVIEQPILKAFRIQDLNIGLAVQSNYNTYRVIDNEKFIFAKLKYGL